MIRAEKKRSMTKIETHTVQLRYKKSRNNIQTMNRWIDLRADEDNCDKNPLKKNHDFRAATEETRRLRKP